MGIAPLATPLHSNARSNRRPSVVPPPTPMSISGPSQPRRVLSPPPDEISSPRALESVNSTFSAFQSSLSSSSELANPGDQFVEDVFDEASVDADDDEDDSVLLGEDILATLGRRSYEERGSLGWRGWLGVAAFGVISGSVIFMAGNAKKETQPEKRYPTYYIRNPSLR